MKLNFKGTHWHRKEWTGHSWQGQGLYTIRGPHGREHCIFEDLKFWAGFERAEAGGEFVEAGEVRSY